VPPAVTARGFPLFLSPEKTKKLGVSRVSRTTGVSA
jgi:hypothetical protein